MNARKTLFRLMFVLLPALLPARLAAGNTRPAALTVEYAETPLGIDVGQPRFSWQMTSGDQQRGCRQIAYRIIVADERGQEVWNSGKKESDASLNIVYEGMPLEASTRYDWRLEVWDGEGAPSSAASWFETGLMNPDPGLSAWDGAKWIGGGDSDLALCSSYIPVFKISYSVQLDKKSTRAGFIYGANDLRLMDKYKNIFQIESLRDGSYIMVELDIAGLEAGDSARMNVYRAGYHPSDKKDVPFKSLVVPPSIINSGNMHRSHTIHIHSRYGWADIYIDGTDAGDRIGGVGLNPVGGSSDYTSFPMLADIGFCVPAKQKALFSNIEIRNYRDPANLLFNEEPVGGIFSEYAGKGLSVKDGAYLVGGKAETRIIADPSRNSMPMLRTGFDCRSEAAKARLYVTSRGIYEIYINGRRVGSDCFNPGVTQYNKTHLYQTYDVTEYIKSGGNAMGALLGEGWWSGSATYTDIFWNFFGDRQSLLAKLVITYPDGMQETVVTDPSRWTYCNDGPIVYGSFFQGEVYDAQREPAVKGWAEAGFDDSDWTRAREIGLEYISRDKSNLERGAPMVDDYSKMSLVGQFGNTAAKVRELTAQSVEEVRPGVFVYDMGQNMVGVPRIDLKGQKPGTRIILRYAEVKYPDMAEYEPNVGMVMLENIRGALAQDTYVTRGGDETINPRFTFHGYRFLEITGIDAPVPVEAVKGEVISSIHRLASGYETSNPKVNKLWENITWSTLGNFLSIPTDCPQRNERLGWSGDISVFSRTATYLGKVPQFLRRHMLAMRDVQREDGRFPDVAPYGGGFGGILWGSAGITVAWESYRQYDDKLMLAEHYDAMKSYIGYLTEFIDPVTGILTEGVLGDWLGPEQDRNDNTLLWEAYFIYDLEIMGKMAAALDKESDARMFGELRARRKEFFNRTYVAPGNKKTIHSGFRRNANTRDTIDTQTSYVLPLVFDAYSDENKAQALDNLLATIRRENTADIGTLCPPYSLMTGFIGTAWIGKVLSDNGYGDVAYRMLQQITYPSWLYSVDQGATTIWERLNSYTHTDGFGGNNSMNSFNHYSFGAVGAWMYNYSLGIERDEDFQGFKRFVLQPEPDPTGQMTFAKGHYDSMYGRIESSWEIEGGACHYRFTVPCNTTATLYLRSPSVDMLTEGGKAVKDAAGVEYLGIDRGKVKLELQPGRYHFVSRSQGLFH